MQQYARTKATEESCQTAPIRFQNMTVITISLRRQSPEYSDHITIVFRCQVASHIPSWQSCWRSFPHSTGYSPSPVTKSMPLTSDVQILATPRIHAWSSTHFSPTFPLCSSPSVSSVFCIPSLKLVALGVHVKRCITKGCLMKILQYFHCAGNSLPEPVSD